MSDESWRSSYDNWKCTEPSDMADRRAHTHKCPDCKRTMECDGTWERNYDGIPEVICSDFHLPNGEVVVCEACQELRDSPACDECGEQVELNDRHLCAACEAIRVNQSSASR